MIETLPFIRGTEGLEPTQVNHLLVPSRGRGSGGESLSIFSARRTECAAWIYRKLNLAEQGGIIVCAGNKTPGDLNEGRPEAIMMQELLIEHGIPKDNIRTETGSPETCTQLINSQQLFPDKTPVGIVSQRAHLTRIMQIIAPKTMARSYIGFITPEVGNQIDKDSKLIGLVSRFILMGLGNEIDERVNITALENEPKWRLKF
jgi:hypothetical protein